MELAGALALATAGLAAGASAGGAAATTQAIAWGLSLARRATPRTLPLCGAGFGLGFALVVLGAGTPTLPPGTSAGPGPGWVPVVIGLGWVAVGLWALLVPGRLARERGAHHRAAGRPDATQPHAGAAVAVAFLGGASAGWLRPPHAGPVLALLSASLPDGGTGTQAYAHVTPAAVTYQAGAGLALALALTLAGAVLQRMLAAVRLGWLGPLLLLGWGAAGAAGGYGWAAEAILRYWPLSGLG
jgi:cytochrome c biogenesis protein CcdA